MAFDRSKVPKGGWTPENIKAYRDYDLLQYRLKAETETLEDPEGRIKKGQRIRWKHDERGDGLGDMEVIYLCAPGGLYRRPLREDDPDPVAGMARQMNALVRSFPTFTEEDSRIFTVIPCPKEHPEATYDLDGLMIFFRYLYSDTCTTCHAKDVVVVSENL